jgi:hypothetical protein
MKTLALAVVLFAVTMSAQAQADFDAAGHFSQPAITGGDYQRGCASFRPGAPAPIGVDANEQEAGCVAYTLGVLAGMRASGVWDSKAPDRPCLPDSYSDTEIIRVVLKFLDSHPEDLHYPAGSMVVGALGVAYGTTGLGCK